jgi:hypothetical protein
VWLRSYPDKKSGNRFIHAQHCLRAKEVEFSPWPNSPGKHVEPTLPRSQSANGVGTGTAGKERKDYR